MQKTLTSNLKVTTLWPELANHRILSLDSQLEEVRLEIRGAYLMVCGFIHRKLVCFNGRNQCRKVEDRVQFAVNLPLPAEASPPLEVSHLSEMSQLENLSLSNVELIQNDFVFQPRQNGDGPALLEQNYTLTLHCPLVRPILRRKALSVWARLVIGKGRGNMVLDLPVGLLTSALTPRHFNGTIRILSPVCPPVIGGVLMGTITYCSPGKELKEMDFETTINFLMDRPPVVQGNQELRVSADLVATKWRKSPRDGSLMGGWRLEIKFQYQWQLIEERELEIATVESGEGLASSRLNNYAAITRLKKLDLQLFREYEFPGWSFEPGELKVRLEEYRGKLVPAGLLISGILRFEAYGIDTAGRERFHTQLVSFEELTPLAGVSFPEGELGEFRIQPDSEVIVAQSGYKNGIQWLEVLFKFFVSLYREQIIAISPPASSGTPILACLIGEQQEFTLEGETTLTLQIRPRQITKLKVRVIEANSVVNDGWLGINGRMEVAVGFVDERFHYYETSFNPLFQGVFNWDKLQLQDTVWIQCRLDHYSYTWDGIKVHCRYWLRLNGENRRETEILVEIARPQSNRVGVYPENERLKIGNSQDSIPQYSGRDSRIFNVSAAHGELGRLGIAPSVNSGISIGAPWRLVMTVEVPLKTGFAREGGTASLRLSDAGCRLVKGGLIIEGVLTGEIEYWDQNLYLQGESVKVSFWRFSQLRTTQGRCSPQYPGFSRMDRNLKLELGEVTVIPFIPSSRGKGKVWVRFELMVGAQAWKE